MKEEQGRLFAHHGSRPVDVEDRFVVTYQGTVVRQGTRKECTQKLAEEVASWKLQTAQVYAKQRHEPYTKHVLVSWAPPGEEHTFLWTQQVVFADAATPDPESGLPLVEFVVSLSGQARRIFIDKLPVYTTSQGWIGAWKTRMQDQPAKAQATATNH